MLTDYHVHLINDDFLDPCPYNLRQIEQYLKEGQKNGVEEICFTDHCNRFVEFREYMKDLIQPHEYSQSTLWMTEQFYEPLERYVESIYKAKQKGWPVKLGLELDYLPQGQEVIPEILQPYPWDYILGSVHFIDKWGFDASADIGWTEKDIDEVYRQYFSLVGKAISSELFDGIAHIDLIKKFGHKPKGNLDHLYKPTVELLQKHQKCLEVSSAGLRRGELELYPSFELLRLANEHDVPITLGSDAHCPKDVGADFDNSVSHCQRAGYQKFLTFSARIPHLTYL